MSQVLDVPLWEHALLQALPKKHWKQGAQALEARGRGLVSFFFKFRLELLELTSGLAENKRTKN
jgi:hypothetical protein